MTDMPISRELADRLIALADEEGRSLEDFLNIWLHNRTLDSNPPNEEESWALRMARQAEQDTDIEWNELAPHLAERSREILHARYQEAGNQGSLVEKSYPEAVHDE